MVEQYVVQAKCVFSKFIDVHIVSAESNDHALQQWRSLNGKLGINVDTRYIEDSIKVHRAGLTDDLFFRDIRLANSSTVSNHNFGVSIEDTDCGNPKDKHFLTMEEAKRTLSKLDYAELFVNTDSTSKYDSKNEPPF